MPGSGVGDERAGRRRALVGCPPARNHPIMRRRSRPYVALASATLLAMVLPGINRVAAQSDLNPSATTSELQKENDALFAQLLKDPTNVDLTFRYAEAAAKLGNVEAAISSLERLLLYNRDFPGVKLELAELYARIGSYAMARTYLTEAEEAPGTDAATLARVQAVRDLIEHGASLSQFTYSLVTGLRHQTDVTGSPAGADIIAGGVPQTLSSVIANKPGWDAFATGNVQHTYDFGDIKLETNGIAYYSKQFELSPFDLGAIEVNSGPRFDVRGGDNLFFSARPYLVANEVLLGNSQYLWSAGAGIGINRNIIGDLSFAGFYEFRNEHFTDTTASPAATIQSGNVSSFGGTLTYQVTEDGILSYQTSYAITNTFGNIDSSKGLVLRLGYTQTFQLPANLGVGPLIVMPVVYRIYSRDDGPDPAVSPTLITSSQEWRYGGTAKLGLTDNLAATLFAIHEVTLSDVPSSRDHNTQVVLSLLVAF